MKKMRYLFIALAIAGIFALSIQSNVFAADREIPITPQISAASFECTYNLVSDIGGDVVYTPTGTIVTINNGAAARNVIIQFSTEAVVTAGSMYIHYSIDGAAPILIGPEYFGTNTTYETRTHIGVINLPAGSHTIEPYIYSTGGAADTASVYFRCLTAEGRTK
jgi:hypothetical protein